MGRLKDRWKSDEIYLALAIFIISIGLISYGIFYNYNKLQALKADFSRLLVSAEELNKDAKIIHEETLINEINILINKGELNSLNNKVKEFERIVDTSSRILAEDIKKRIEAEEKASESPANTERSKAFINLQTNAKPQTSNCNQSTIYVVVSETTNTEYIYKGDPNCRTGQVISTFKVATGKHTTCWNPYAGYYYNCTTPLTKWKIISKEKTSDNSQFGPWFLRLSDTTGSWNYTANRSYYGLHGTNEPDKIGTWASAGCIRHYNADIIYLNSILPVGTIVWTIK